MSQSPRAVIETVKPAEDGRGVVVRLYEAHNSRGPVSFTLSPDVVSVEEIPLLEDGPGTPVTVTNGQFTLSLCPYEIVTLRLHPREP